MWFMIFAAILLVMLVGGCASQAKSAKDGPVPAESAPPAAPAAPAGPKVPENVELVHDVVIGTGGGRPLHVEIARPKVAPSGLMPAVVMIHGGGWSAGSHKDSRMYLYLAAHGYFAASVEYRLSGEARWPAQIEDCKLGVRWLRANAAKYHVDPNRIACLGGSAGGHLAACLATLGDDAGLEGDGGYPGVSSQVQAVVDFSGPTDLTKLQMVELFGGTAAEKPEAYRQASPILHIHPGLPPFLVMHGDQDKIVNVEQSTSFVAALKKAGQPVESIIVKGGDHGLTPQGPNADPDPFKDPLWQASLDFLDQNLRQK